MRNLDAGHEITPSLKFAPCIQGAPMREEKRAGSELAVVIDALRAGHVRDHPMDVHDLRTDSCPFTPTVSWVGAAKRSASFSRSTIRERLARRLRIRRGDGHRAARSAPVPRVGSGGLHWI